MKMTTFAEVGCIIVASNLVSKSLGCELRTLFCAEVLRMFYAIVIQGLFYCLK